MVRPARRGRPRLGTRHAAPADPAPPCHALQDIYTTCITLPRASHLPRLSGSSSTEFDYSPSRTPSHTHSQSTDSHDTTHTSQLAAHNLTTEHDSLRTSTSSTGSVDWHDTMHKLAVDTMAATQCLVSLAPAPSTPPTSFDSLANSRTVTAAKDSDSTARSYNFVASGPYQQVMAARGALMRDNPFKVSRAAALPSPRRTN